MEATRRFIASLRTLRGLRGNQILSGYEQPLRTVPQLLAIGRRIYIPSVEFTEDMSLRLLEG